MNLASKLLTLSLFAALPGLALGVEVGEPAPACPLKTLSGDAPVSLSQHQGKVVYLDFWASWCGPCAQSLPFLSDLQAELKGQGLEVVTVNLDENTHDAEAFLAEHPVKLTSAAAPDGKCPEIFGVQAMPSSYLLDRHGKVRHVHLGFRPENKAEIRSQILALLAEK